MIFYYFSQLLSFWNCNFRIAFVNFCKFTINIVFAIPFGAASGKEITLFVFHFVEQTLQQHFMCKLGTWHYGICVSFVCIMKKQLLLEPL